MKATPTDSAVAPSSDSDLKTGLETGRLDEDGSEMEHDAAVALDSQTTPPNNTQSPLSTEEQAAPNMEQATPNVEQATPPKEGQGTLNEEQATPPKEEQGTLNEEQATPLNSQDAMATD